MSSTPLFEMATSESKDIHEEKGSIAGLTTPSFSVQDKSHTKRPRSTTSQALQEDVAIEYEQNLRESLRRISTTKSGVQTTTHPEGDLEHSIVGWDGQDDPQNPINFPRQRKWGLLSLVSAISFVSPLASSMFAPAVSFMGEDFGESSELLLSFTVSVYLLGYVVSPTPCVAPAKQRK